MTRLLVPPQAVPGWTGGLVQDVEPGVLPLGHIVEGQNFVALPAGRQVTRGGSRVMLTLHGVGGVGEEEVNQVCLLAPFTPVGMVAVSWLDSTNKHYAYRLTADCAFVTGTESTSRVDLTAAPSTGWANTTTPARPVAAELFEKLFLVDATTAHASRNMLLSMDSTGTILMPTFAFAGGAASALTPYTCEEYNGVLFIAGYGDEGDKDRPEILRHSFLAKSPDAADGFDADAYLLLGAKGQRVTALRKGRGLLLAAKGHEFYRITGFGRAYPGWQYQVENVQNTLGLGVLAPHALTFAEGYWYGTGAQGPFRTDGYVVESLTGPRQRGWRSMDNVDRAFVTYHPDRRAILFGVHPTTASSGKSATYPWTQWVWDIERSTWQTDWVHAVAPGFVMMTPVSTSTALGPTASPSSPSTSAETPTGYTANWTNGDATAETEVWQKVDTTGTWTKVADVAAGTATKALTLHSHTLVYWKARHRKNGVVTPFTAETVARSNIRTSDLTVKGTAGSKKYIGGFCDGRVVMSLERSAIGAGVWSVVQTQTITATPTYSDNSYLFLVDTGYDYRVRGTDAAWSPTAGAYSTTLTVP